MLRRLILWALGFEPANEIDFNEHRSAIYADAGLNNRVARLEQNYAGLATGFVELEKESRRHRERLDTAADNLQHVEDASQQADAEHDRRLAALEKASRAQADAYLEGHPEDRVPEKMEANYKAAYERLEKESKHETDPAVGPV